MGHSIGAAILYLSMIPMHVSAGIAFLMHCMDSIVKLLKRRMCAKADLCRMARLNTTTPNAMIGQHRVQIVRTVRLTVLSHSGQCQCAATGRKREVEAITKTIFLTKVSRILMIVLKGSVNQTVADTINVQMIYLREMMVIAMREDRTASLGLTSTCNGRSTATIPNLETRLKPNVTTAQIAY
jgi:hypothetical protein